MLAAEPSMSQMTPLRRKNVKIEIEIEIKNYELKELRPTPHLFPEEAGQTKRGTVATTDDEQTGGHEQKQDHVGNYCGDESK
jgi:hypothetical protein